MLRTAFVYTVSFVLAVAVLLVSLFAVVFRPVHALSDLAASASPTPQERYFGNSNLVLLQNSPLWPLLALRDHLMLSLASSDRDNCHLRLTLASNRLDSATQLIRLGKLPLAANTALKGELYLLEAIRGHYVSTERLDRQEAILLSRAVTSHKEILASLQKTYPELASPLIPAVQVNTQAEVISGQGLQRITAAVE
jgi:hypothetical protein